jgi:NAD(P)-dependent dehydrogenase (short-subunit alcohol dehydrogenase family)
MTSPTVLITGALSGIGRATAFAYARQGAHLAISGRRAAEGEVLAAELNALGAETLFIRADVRHEDEVQRLFAKAISYFGRLDVLVNSAGAEGHAAPFTDVTAEEYQAVFETNVLGTLLGTKHALRAMQAQRSGSIVNISSTMGSRGAPNMALYTASKHAVEGLTKSAAIEAAADGVRVNAVAPGPTETAMLDRLTGGAERKAAFAAGLPMKRLGTAEEVADAILFIASEKAGFITGEIIHVNGGKTAF